MFEKSVNRKKERKDNFLSTGSLLKGPPEPGRGLFRAGSQETHLDFTPGWQEPCF